MDAVASELLDLVGLAGLIETHDELMGGFEDELSGDFGLSAFAEGVVEVRDLLGVAGAPVGGSAAVVEDVVGVGARDHLASVVEGDLAFLGGDFGDAVFAGDLDFDLCVVAIVVHAPEGGLDAVLEGDESVGAVLDIDEVADGVMEVMVVAVGDGDVAVVEVAALVAIADEPAHEVDGVDGLVDDGAAALHLPSALPVAAGVVFGGTAPGDVALGGLDGAEAAAVEGVLDEDGAGVVAVLEDDAERLAGLVGGVDHGLRLFHGDGHGLLREDVAAQLQGADSHGRVQVVRQADVHDVQLLLGDHLLEVRVGLLAAEQLGACLGALLDEVAAGDQLDALLGLRGHAMERRNTATADDTDSQFLLHNVRMLPYLGGSLHSWQKGTVTGRWMRFAGVVSHSLSAAGTLLARVPCLM